MATDSPPLAVLFVCLGNHCRSPSAHAVVEHHLAIEMAASAGSFVQIDSAGTSRHHVGDLPHPLATAEGGRRGYRLTHIGRQIHPDDFERFDLIVAMDTANVDDLMRMRGHHDLRHSWYRTVEPEQVQLLRRWDPYAMPGDEDLADPWGEGPDVYRTMFDTIERCIPPLLEHARRLHAEHP